MGAWQFWRVGTRRFYQHWGSYTALIFSTNLAISYLAIPFFNWALAQLLKWQGVAYVSYTNFGQLIVQQPLAILGMLVILLALISLVYWQFAFLLFGIMNILNGRPQSIRAVLKATIRSLNHTSLGTFLFFIGYFIVILPFGSYFFTTPLLNKARIPAFIVSFLLEKPALAVALGLFYLGAGYLGLRLINLLPLMMLEQLPWRQAVQQSWQQTRRHQWWRYLWRLLVILGLLSAIVFVIYGVIYFAQLGFDQTKLGLPVATLNLFLMEVVTEIIICYTTALLMMLMIAIYRQDLTLPQQQPFNEGRHLKRLTRGTVITGLVLASGLLVAFNLIYLNGLALTQPLLISHRGVDDGNGVQNTIPALIKTSREHPDYIEMDVQVTKDHQFVVMHDTKLKHLAGISKKPAQLTLAQLQRLTVRENGYQAKIPSFDRYLAAANQHHQKLLVEIKTTSAYTRQNTQHFIDRYGATLRQQHDQVQSLSYTVMTDLKKHDVHQSVSYILPYNLTFPNTAANGYTMEATTLNDRFVDQAERHQQTVYAWDIDDTDLMDQMMFMGVTGIITDKLKTMQAESKANTEHPGYAKLLLTFMNEFSLTSNE